MTTTYFPGASGNYLFTKDSWFKVGGYLPAHGLDTWSFGFRQVMEGGNIVTLKDTRYFHRYGIDNSYWTEFEKKYNPSMSALAYVIPYINRISKSDERYMFGRGRRTWLSKLDKHPIKINEYERVK